MRLIDADELKEHQCVSIKRGRIKDGMVRISDIDAMPTIDAEPVRKWISVKDRLPEVDTNVVVYAEGKNDPIYRIVITSMSDRNIFDPRIKREPYWREPWQFFDTMYEITNWMPLPEPPKEDEYETD